MLHWGKPYWLHVSAAYQSWEEKKKFDFYLSRNKMIIMGRYCKVITFSGYRAKLTRIRNKCANCLSLVFIRAFLSANTTKIKTYLKFIMGIKNLKEKRFTILKIYMLHIKYNLIYPLNEASTLSLSLSTPFCLPSTSKSQISALHKGVDLADWQTLNVMIFVVNLKEKIYLVK